MRRKLRLLAVLAVLAVLATGAYAFTDANIVPNSVAGFGAGTVSGYGVSDITYDLDPVNANVMTDVYFKLSGASAPTEVTVDFGGPGDVPGYGQYSAPDDCTISGSGPWDVHCDVHENPAGITQVKIGAAQ